MNVSINITRTLERAFFPASIAFLVVALFGVRRFAGEITAIKGSYALIGVLLGAGLYYTVSWATPREASEDTTEHDGGGVGTATSTVAVAGLGLTDRDLAVGVYAVTGMAVAVAAVVGERVLPVVVGLAVGYTLLGVQLRLGSNPRRLLPQVMALFLVSPATQYLTAGFYFSNGDTFGHVRRVEVLLATGLPIVGDQYQHFPGLHSVVGTVSLLGGVDPYDALMLFGLLAFASMIPLTYLLGRVVTGSERLGLFVALGLAFVEPIGFFATYFFPQALGVVLTYFLVYLAYRATSVDRRTRARITLLSVTLGSSIVLVHHLAVVLLVPTIVGLAVLPTVLGWVFFRTSPVTRSQIVRPRVVPVVVTFAVAVGYWAVQNTFVGVFIGAVATLLFGTQTIVTDSGSTISLLTYGTSLPVVTEALAIRSIASLDGVYFIALVGVFCLGVAASLHHADRFAPLFGVLAVGVASAPFVFRTPLAVGGLARLRLPLSIFFAVVVGVGLYVLVVNNRKSVAWSGVAVALVVVLGVTMPLVASNDLYELKSGIDLYELQPVPEAQHEFSDREYAALAVTSDFVKTYEPVVVTMSTSRKALERFDAPVATSLQVSTAGVETGEVLFLYRTRWTDHGVTVGTGDFSAATLVMSEAYFDGIVRGSHKVYDAGPVGMVWNEDGGLVGSDGPGHQPLVPV